jgi:hypothetical protein
MKCSSSILPPDAKRTPLLSHDLTRSLTARPKAMTFWVRNILFLTAFVVLVLAEILLSLTNLNALVAQQALTISGYETKDDVQHLRIAADGI